MANPISRLASDRLTTGLQRYREVAVLLSDHPTVLDLALSVGPGAGEDQEAGDATAARELFQNMADKTGAHSLMLVARDGTVLAAAGEQALPKGAQSAFARAMDGALGVAHFVDTGDRRRYVFAAPVFVPGGASIASVIVNVDIGVLEWGWPTESSAIYFTDDYGVVFVANRSELVLRGGVSGPMPVTARYALSGHEIWVHEAGPYIPSPALHLYAALACCRA